MRLRFNTVWCDQGLEEEAEEEEAAEEEVVSDKVLDSFISLKQNRL